MSANEPGIAPLSPPVLRRLAAVLAPALVLLALGIGTVWTRERGRDRERARRSAFDAVRIQAHSAIRVVEMVGAILLYLAEDDEVLELVRGSAAPGARARVEADFERFRDSAWMYGAARLFGPEDAGSQSEVLAGRAQAGDAELLARARAELSAGEVFVSSFALVNGDPVIHLATLVPPAATGGGGAALVLDYHAESILQLVRQTGLQLAGWTALVDGEGHFLEAPPERIESAGVEGDDDASWTAQRGAPPAFARGHPEAFAALGRGRVGTFLGPRGLYVFSGVPAPSGRVPARSELDLAAVCHVPLGELYARSNRTLRVLLLGGAAVAFLVGAIGWRLALASAVRAEGERRLERSERGLRKLSARLVEAQEDERRRIARDLHDELGQQATAIAISIKRAARTEDDAARGRLLALATEGTDELLAGMHRMATSLRSTLLDDLGLKAALEAACADLRERAALAVVSELEFDDGDVPAELAQTVYRFVQEGLTNALKHAEAEQIVVSVRNGGSRLEAEVRDDGVGFDPSTAEAGDRLGLLGMRERIALARGEFRLDSAPGAGTRLSASLPVARAGEQAGEASGE